jgi:hypothetical protein
MIRALALGSALGAAVVTIVGVAFYYGIWPISALLDRDTIAPF